MKTSIAHHDAKTRTPASRARHDADSRISPTFALFFALLTALAIEAVAKPLPAYFRYDLLKSGALTHLAVGDFDGDGLADIAGLSPSQRSLVLISAKGKFAFRPHQSFALPSRAQSLFALNLPGEKQAHLAMLASSPSRAQMWQIGGVAGKFVPKKRAELSLPEAAERLYLSGRGFYADLRAHLRFFALAPTGSLATFSFHAQEGFSKVAPLALSHRVSEVILSARPTTDFFTRAVGENVFWLHRSPPSSPLPIRCKESVSLAATDDFNKNGLLDLAIVQAIANGRTVIEVMFDIGVETGVAPIRFDTPLNAKFLFIQDFNADGLLDIGLSDGSSFVIHFARSATSFSESVIIAFSDVASGIAIADLNQDEKPELIVSEQKTGKLVVYSSTHYEQMGVERLATSGEPERLAFHPARKQLLVGCNRHKRLEQMQVERETSLVGSFSVMGKVASIWQDDDEMIWLTTSPVTLGRRAYKSDRAVSHQLFSLGASQSLFWRASKHQPTMLAVLEERVAGAVPQLLFYSLKDDSARAISELLIDAPINAEGVASIAGATLKEKNYLIALTSDATAQAIVVYELKTENNRLRLVETERHALPNHLALQGATHLFVKVNKNETMDFLVASSKSAATLLAERLHQPRQISNFPKISDGDVALWTDSDGDELADLVVSRHQRAEVLFLRGRPRGDFDPPKKMLGDVVATGIVSVVGKRHLTLFVANAKLHTIDILRLKK